MVDAAAVLLLVLLERPERLAAELAPPADEQFAVGRRRRARSAERALGRHNRLERVDALLHARLVRDTVQTCAGGDEAVDLRHGADGPGDAGAYDARERLQRRLAAVAENEVVRRSPQRRTDDRARVLDEPELVLGIEAGLVAERPGEPEDQVVARLVGEQLRRPCEELRDVGRLDNLHPAIL